MKKIANKESKLNLNIENMKFFQQKKLYYNEKHCVKLYKRKKYY